MRNQPWTLICPRGPSAWRTPKNDRPLDRCPHRAPAPRRARRREARSRRARGAAPGDSASRRLAPGDRVESVTAPDAPKPKPGGHLCNCDALHGIDKDPYAKEWSGKVAKSRKRKRETPD